MVHFPLGSWDQHSTRHIQAPNASLNEQTDAPEVPQGSEKERVSLEGSWEDQDESGDPEWVRRSHHPPHHCIFPIITSSPSLHPPHHCILPIITASSLITASSTFLEAVFGEAQGGTLPTHVICPFSSFFVASRPLACREQTLWFTSLWVPGTSTAPGIYRHQMHL